ncbi:MAG: hypothetical protein AB8G15_12830 [Saprospiraceae bacterium]
MPRILFFLVCFLAFAGICYLVLRMIYQLITNHQPNVQKIKADLATMRVNLVPWISRLVPWKPEEIELLSLNQTDQTIVTGVTTEVKGIFTSIYSEPMFVYAYKRYYSKVENAILYVRTSHREFIYRIEGAEIKLHIDDHFVGKIKDRKKLYGAKTDRLLGQITEGRTLQPIILGDQEQGILLAKEVGTKTNARAFQFVNKMDKEAEANFLALAVLQMIEKDLPQQ